MTTASLTVKQGDLLTDSQSPARGRTALLPALTGVRFFAIFHIFMFHLWDLYNLEKPDKFADLMIGFAGLPETLVTFISHGWLSTSFFFLLSGFILAYLYWGEDGRLVTGKKRFWLLRFSRIYPIHIGLMIITVILIANHHLSNDMPVWEMVLTALATLTLLQAWYPPAVPLWSWPTWTLSALIFLYLLTPWLMRLLGGLTRRRMIWTLAAMPVVSLLPTIVYAIIVPAGTKLELHWSIFLGSTPLFWLPHFMAGMLLSRIFSISRYNTAWKSARTSRFAWGDVALLAVIGIACMPGMGEEPLKYFLRHGMIMPLYMLVILDLARGNGWAARFFSLPGMGFLGETGFSIFIWQNLIMIFCWISLMISPNAGAYHLWAAPVAVIIIAIISTYWIEKPIAGWLRRKIAD
ncbi:MAG TPA: acyltransferase [Gammaproteobacteria bacterium]